MQQYNEVNAEAKRRAWAAMEMPFDNPGRFSSSQLAKAFDIHKHHRCS
jgi:hypothetical protein